jgi:hypothetical protein
MPIRQQRSDQPRSDITGGASDQNPHTPDTSH